jgi:hypothetical protein
MISAVRVSQPQMTGDLQANGRGGLARSQDLRLNWQGGSPDRPFDVEGISVSLSANGVVRSDKCERSVSARRRFVTVPQ